MKLTRVYRFSASHRLHSDQLSPEDNAELYGKCNNPYGHGHNYALEVTVRGEVDAATGRVIEPGTLDRYVLSGIIADVDHKDLNCDVPAFQSLVPTTENLAIVINRCLIQSWPFEKVRLHRIFIRETPRNTFELRSE